MNARLGFANTAGLHVFSAALLAGVIAGALFSATSGLFQSRGMPMEQSAAAERACASQPYRSLQVACINEWLAARRPTSVANK